MGNVAEELGEGRFCSFPPCLLALSGLEFASIAAWYEKPPHYFKLMNRIVIGVDGYNQSITGDVSRMVPCAATDCDHIPLVIVKRRTMSNDGTNDRKGIKQKKG